MSASWDVVDLFAGPGGWDEGLAKVAPTLRVAGLEWDDAACDTAEAAGHVRHRVDVAAADPADYQGVSGLIASPPCQAFSMAGLGHGRAALDDIVSHVFTCTMGWVKPNQFLCSDDLRADLTLEPLRWIDALRPEWVALEQVPPVLPIWRAIAIVLEQWGYSTAVAVLNAADYGVPQTRRRAVLLAHRDLRVSIPVPTHHDSRRGASLFGEPWVTMADALGWGDGELDRRTNSKAPGWRDGAPMAPTVTVPTDRPAPSVTGKAGGQWVLRNNNQERACVRTLDEPAGTIFVGNNLNRIEWCYERPATTVQCDPRIGRPGHKDREGGESQFAHDAVRVEQWELGVLQSFRADYPWHGTRTQQGQQVGNAIPPLLAAAVLTPLLERTEVPS